MSENQSTLTLAASDSESDDPPAWRRATSQRLAAGPDPERARTLADRVLEAASEHATLSAARSHPDAFASVIAATCGVAPFLAAHLVRHPDWLAALACEDYSAPRPQQGEGSIAARLAALPARSADLEAALRRFKYYELARITVRDTNPKWLPLERSAETLEELSALADALLARAAEEALAAVANEIGEPIWHDARGRAQRLGFAVLGLGKLGSRELNYSSDVDLVYVHGTPAEGSAAGGPGGLTPLQYFSKVAQYFGRLVTSVAAEGFLYRIDLDLRPEGAQGVLVSSETALEAYYESWAATWERAAFMKARPVAGDLELGWRAVRSVAPMIYRSAMDFEGVRGIRALKDKIESARVREGDGFDVKLGAGGIRDIEFVAQALQMLHGARIPQLRERSTQGVLEQTATLGLLDARDVESLLRAYRFLRRVENRLQMVAELQTHRLPTEASARLRIARACGFAGGDPEALDHFDAEVARWRETTRGIYDTLLPEDTQERILDLIARASPALVALDSTRRLVEDLAGRLAHDIETSPSPERALNNLARFVEGVGSRRFYYELLLDRPAIASRLVGLFATSNYLSALLARHPRLIEAVFSDPNVLLLSRKQLEQDLATLRDDSSADADPVEARLSALRRFHHRHVLNVALLDTAGRVDRDEVGAALSDIAEVCLEDALDVAHEQLEGRRARLSAGDRVRFLVVGMGKLGTRELGYGSDLDVIFLYDVVPGAGGAEALAAERLEAGDYCARLAQRLIAAVQTRTADGNCYEIDARLRPSGNQGVLVTSLTGFERYHLGESAQRAEVWERQALLRARGCAGNRDLAERFEELRRRILRQPFDEALRPEIHRIRMRMEDELARETRTQRDFKAGRGGVLDVESIVQLEQLRGACDEPSLLDVVPLSQQIDRLEQLGHFDAKTATALREGWHFLQRLSSRLRIVENRSISELDEERGDLEAVALGMGYRPQGREGSARRELLRDYRRHSEAIRAIYLERVAAQADT